MAGEVHGKNTRVHFAAFDITHNLRKTEVTDTIAADDATTFGDDAHRYIVGLEDGIFSADGLYSYDDDAVREAVLAANRVNNSLLCVWPDTDAIGKPGEGLAGIQTARSVSTPVADVSMISLAMQSSLGIEDLVSLHAMGEETADSNFSTVDNAAATTDGGVGYLQVSKVTAGSLVVTIQHSTDGSTWVDLITFDSVNADHTAQRVKAAGTVRRYARAVLDITTGPATFAVALGRTPNA